MGDNGTLRDQVDAALRRAVISIQPSNRLDGHTAAVLAVDFSPDGQQIAIAGVDGTVQLWQPDGTLLATAGDDKTIKLWRRDGTLWRTLQTHGSEGWSIAFSPDSSILISGRQWTHVYSRTVDSRH